MMRIICLCCTFILCFGCGTNDQSSVKAEIRQLEASLQQNPGQETLEKLVDLYQQMADQTSGEEQLGYIWKLGETARSARQFDIAVSAFTKLYEDNPTSQEAAKALFLHAFMCDEDLKDYEKAGELYTIFLERFPESDFSDDAAFLLENLGKSDEEMLRILSEKNKEN